MNRQPNYNVAAPITNVAARHTRAAQKAARKAARKASRPSRKASRPSRKASQIAEERISSVTQNFCGEVTPQSRAAAVASAAPYWPPQGPVSSLTLLMAAEAAKQMAAAATPEGRRRWFSATNALWAVVFDRMTRQGQWHRLRSVGMFADAEADEGRGLCDPQRYYELPRLGAWGVTPDGQGVAVGVCIPLPMLSPEALETWDFHVSADPALVRDRFGPHDRQVPGELPSGEGLKRLLRELVPEIRRALWVLGGDPEDGGEMSTRQRVAVDLAVLLG